ncbi:MAG: DNA gyrase subunit A [Halodesulfurarchaeum sp.]
MSSELPDPTGQIGDQIETVRVEDEMEQSYIDYAMSVIAGRALPDVRDGLKPVHRRILYAMHEAGITSGSGHRKSSSIVGETMGNFHPHGDSAIYDTLVRMAQDFSMRHPLVDGQGNFGSVDGDPAAAMRYTESRMAPIAEELLADIEKDTVDFEPNYDDRLEEPTVLPAAVPNLLVNGSSGIAVGMSTNVPPHNLGEVVDAAIHLLENPDATVADLMEFVPGPDFPTGATIVGKNAIKQAYETGRGRLTVRADYEIEERDGGDRIVLTELPYQQNKSKLVERIAEMVNEGELEGVTDLRDESDRDGIRVVIELKRTANTDIVENRLLESVLERTFGVINLALVDGNPEVLSLRELLQHYLDHRREVVRRRSEHDLSEAKDRAHILEGRLRALDHVEDVVELIRNSEDRDAAKTGLQAEFDFSAEQAQHIVRMQLGSLTSLERTEIEEEYESVQARIERLETILAEESELRAVIEEELREQKEAYADERRTKIIEADGEVTDEDLIPQEDVLITLSEADYIKRVPMDVFNAQHRGGKGIIGTDLKEGDRVAAAFTARTHDSLLCFTDAGQVYRLKAYQVPEMSRTARGTSAVNLLDLDSGENLTAVVATRDVEEDQFLTMVTRQGYVKRTPASDFENILSTGIIATRLEGADELVDVEITDGESQIVIGTRQGRAIRFSETDVRPMGRTARGVRGITLEPGDQVAGVTSVHPADDRDLLTVTENGYGKRTPLAEYRPQTRNGKGLMDIKTDDRNGRVATLQAVSDGDHVIGMSEAGQLIRIPVSEVSAIGRNTKGVLVMRVEATDRLAEVSIFRPLDAESGD